MKNERLKEPLLGVFTNNLPVKRRGKGDFA
jgi:hypothetical protein